MAAPDARAWSDSQSLSGTVAAPEGPDEFVRLWRGFMTARVTLGFALLMLQGTLYVLGQVQEPWVILGCGAYMAAALATRLFSRPRRFGRHFDPMSVATIGVDVAAFALLQFVQGQAGINYALLLALPVLLASVLGSLLLAMGTAAGVTLVLLAQAGLLALRTATDPTALFIQAALTGAGFFVIAFLSSQLSARLASEEQRSMRSQLAVRVQRQVNELVIEALADGILVVDAQGVVWAANPAARRMLGPELKPPEPPFDLSGEPAWRELGRLATASFTSNHAQRANVVLHHPGVGPHRILVRTRMTAMDIGSAERLCVVFLQDQREMEARMRTEKLASMGRMSTAVAHEIRNPLAAIVQANALLDEEISTPALKRLTQLVQQNARRLEGIVDEVLNISRVQGGQSQAAQPGVPVNTAVRRICADWAQHAGRGDAMATELCPGDPAVVFDAEHLRRVLVNLLDNAGRYALAGPRAILVSTRTMASGHVVLSVWSHAEPMDASVERHLFEPFFSSESRSTGLGLYICRELCEGHGATIGFERARRHRAGEQVEGNAFLVRLAPYRQNAPGTAGPGSDKMASTPPWLHDRP